jgi:hypothetical protein
LYPNPTGTAIGREIAELIRAHEAEMCGLVMSGGVIVPVDSCMHAVPADP